MLPRLTLCHTRRDWLAAQAAERLPTNAAPSHATAAASIRTAPIVTALAASQRTDRLELDISGTRYNPLELSISCERTLGPQNVLMRRNATK